ncbi:hypothetical protein CEUSTIGMA_g8113.t1 [Chlamydomonas eustigma]|uniref:Uncharacterized protein n=1 Tax=Chlamydomonas eustigma TaxID=1157962 RepID=A0A250XC77_9CHLO|nr:hypothetical protein CEUSTIGMA_g8113.t1 [Chlamydomonas eustigma]|eukprot:GAX80678.1 hypothetical protein CEUSTIGMA_g8113.t1 [Chlamydomonas eustigma]
MKTPTPLLWKHGYIITGGGGRRDINSHGGSPCTPGPQTHNTISINPGLLAMCQQSAATWARQAEHHVDHGTPTGTSRMAAEHHVDHGTPTGTSRMAAEHHVDHGTPTGTSRMAAGTPAAHTSRLHPDSLNPSSNPPPQAMSGLFPEPSTHHPDASDAYRTGSSSAKESLDMSRRTPLFSVGSNHDVPFSAQVPESPGHSATGSGHSATDTGHSATGRGHSTTGTPTGSTFSSPPRPVLRNLPSPTWVNIPEAGVGSVAVDSRVADEGGLTGGGLEAWIPFTSLMRRGPLPSILQPSIMSRSSARGAAVLQAALPSAIHLKRLPTSPLTQVWSTAADQDTPTHSAPLSKVLLPCTSAVPDDFDGGCVLRDNDRDSSMDQDVRMTVQLEQRSKLHAAAPSLAVHASVAQKGTAAAATIRMDCGQKNRLLNSPSVLNDSRRGGLNVSRTGDDEGGDHVLKGYELPHVQVLLSSDDHGCNCEVETLNPKPSQEDRRVDEGLNAAALASTQRERHDTISGGCIPGRIMSVQESPSEMQRILFLE